MTNRKVLENINLTYFNGLTMATERSVAIPQRFEIEIMANCHDKIPRRLSSQTNIVSQKYANGKKKTANRKSATARDRTK